MQQYLFLSAGVGCIFMRVIQTNFPKGNGLGVTHGSHDALLVNGVVLLGEVRVTSESTPYKLLFYKPLPDGFPLRDPRIAEVGYAAVKFRRETAAVFLPEAPEASAEAQLSIQHIQVTVGVNEAQ